MPTVHLLGKVLPEILQVSVSHEPVLTWKAADLNLVMEFTNHIMNSRIDVECKVNRYAPGDFVFIYMRALDLCRASVDLAGFAMGCGFTVYLDTFVDPAGVGSPILLKDDGLPALCTAFTLTNGFGEVHNIVLQEPGLFMALNDLTAAITLPHVSPVNCARSMERLKHLLASPGCKDKHGWQQMRQALQISEAYLKFITDYSADPRHGRPVHVPGSVTTEVTRRAWTIMNRYSEYRKRGSKPLSVNDFPLLTG